MEPGPIASDFFQTFWDFGVRKKLIFFSLPLDWKMEDIKENVASYGNDITV